MNMSKNIVSKTIVTLLLCIVFATNLFAQSTSTERPNSINWLETLLLISAIVMVLVIWLLSHVLLTISRAIHKKRKEGLLAKTIILIMITSVLSSVAKSQTSQIVTGLSENNNFGGMHAFDFYSLSAVIGLEFIVILFLAFMTKRAFKDLAGEEEILVEKIKTPNKLLSLWKRIDRNLMTRAVPIEKEADILLDHDYDGIKELDNPLPPWWKYGFYFTIAVAIIYTFNFHFGGTGKDPEQEYAAEMIEGEKQEEIYKAKTKNLVDENNVGMSDASGIDAGKTIFLQTCVACHGTKGEGLIGPNLTDNYWIHGSTMNNIYNTIKIGYPEKGMQSWQSMYSPIQIKHLASFIASLKGTNPPNAKAPQGVLTTNTPAQDTLISKASTTTN